jgi:hypothetical protein
MEIIIIGAIVLAVIGYFAFFRKKDEIKVEPIVTSTKAEPVIPAGTEASIAAPATPAATTLDPVAVALDLEPMQISAPVKAPRKPRAPKAVTLKVAKPKVESKANTTKATPTKAKTKKA